MIHNGIAEHGTRIHANGLSQPPLNPSHAAKAKSGKHSGSQAGSSQSARPAGKGTSQPGRNGGGTRPQGNRGREQTRVLNQNRQCSTSLPGMTKSTRTSAIATRGRPSTHRAKLAGLLDPRCEASGPNSPHRLRTTGTMKCRRLTSHGQSFPHATQSFGRGRGVISREKARKQICLLVRTEPSPLFPRTAQIGAPICSPQRTTSMGGTHWSR